MRILFFGDSITQGFWGIEGGWVERIRKHYDSETVKHLDDKIVRNTQPEIFNLGISGDTTRNLLVRIEAETKVRKWQEDPLVVVVAIGTNDDLFENDQQWVGPEEFRSNLEKIVDILTPVADTLVLVGNPACDETKATPVSWTDANYTNRKLQRSERTIAGVANKHRLTYVPIFDAFKSKIEEGQILLADGLHPNDLGHQFIADLVLPKLDELQANWDDGRN